MLERIETIMESLATAFGGHGQYRIGDVGCAIAGHMTNNGLPIEIDAAASIAAAFLAERLDWSPNDEDSTRVDIAEDCRKELDRLHVSHN